MLLERLTGVLTMTGEASLADYLNCSDRPYTNTSDDPSTAVHSITIVVFDGIIKAPSAASVSLAPIDDAGDCTRRCDCHRATSPGRAGRRSRTPTSG